MKILLILLVLALFVELFLSPRIGWTREGDVLLWYYGNGNKREYIKLFKL